MTGHPKLLRTASYAVLAGAAALVLPAAARAADAESQSAGTTVAPVVVTAEHRTVDLGKTPIAASVLTGRDLDDKAIRTVDGLERAVPSLTVSSGGQSNYMNIRGIGKNDNAGNTTSAVATYRDGVGTVSGFFNGEPYYDIQSIEVLRGPQGTFVGQNAAGGAIFVNTHDPVIGGGLHGWAEIGGGNYGQFIASGAVNLPISDDLALRFALNYLHRDSFYQVFMDPGRTIKNPNNVGAQDLISGRLSLLWTPTSALEVKLKVDLNNLDYHGNAYGVVPGFPGARGANLSPDPFIIGNNITDNYYVDQSARLAAQVTYTLPDGIKLKSITGVQYIDSFLRNDDDGSVIPLNGTVTNQQNIEALFHLYSEELSATSPDTGRFNWIGGLYGQNENLRFPAISPDRSNGFLLFDTSLTPAVGPPPQIPPDLLMLDWTTTRHTLAAFGQVGYHVTDDLQLQVGLRYTYYRVTQNAVLGVPFPVFGVLHNAEQDSDVTGKIALNWQVNPDNYVYGFVASGHTTGGINVVNLPGLVPLTFGPQETYDYEVGWKGRLFDDHLHAQVGFFYNDIRHYQADFVRPGSFGNLVFFQTLDTPTKDYGIEVTWQGKFEHFTFDGGFSAIHSALGSGLVLDVSPPGTTTTAGAQVQVSGHHVPYTPPITVNVGAGYEFALPDDATLTPRFDVAWVDTQISNILDLETTSGIFFQRIKAHSIANLELVYAKDGLTVTGYVTNLANTVYMQSAGGGGDNAYYNAPRQFGVRINKTF